MTTPSDAPGRLVTLASGIRMLVDPADDAFAGAIADDAYEWAERECVRLLAREGDVVVDGGAHIGAYALPLAHVVGDRGHIHAFEPLDSNATWLDRSIRANGFEGRISLHRQALGDARGQGHLRHGPEARNGGHAWLERHPGAPALSPSDARTCVDVVPLDDCDLERPVGLLKLDIEGAEFLALRGARTVLGRDRPTIVTEIDYAQLARVSNATPQDLFDFLDGFSYSPHAIRFDGAVGEVLEHPPTARVSSVVFLPG